MIRTTIILISFALCVLGDGHAVSEQHIKIHHGHHGELTHIGSKEPEHHEEYAWTYPSYEFSYSVHDPHTHDNKGQHESRKGDEVKGEYWLIQPDGRKRTVKYHADKHSGFQATVHYSDDHHHVTEHHGHKHEKKSSGSGSSSSSSESGSSSSSSESGSSSSSSSSESKSDERSGEETRARKGTVVRWNPSNQLYAGQPSRINPRFYKPEPQVKIAKPQ